MQRLDPPTGAFSSGDGERGVRAAVVVGRARGDSVGRRPTPARHRDAARARRPACRALPKNVPQFVALTERLVLEVEFPDEGVQRSTRPRGGRAARVEHGVERQVLVPEEQAAAR